MGDDKGAMEAFEQALAIDGTDDELRARFVALASKQGRFVDAAKALQRVLATAKDPAAKARTSTQLGEMFLRGGEARRAKATLAGVLAAADSPPDAMLAAAHLLREVHAAEKDLRALCEVLEKVSTLEPDAARRQEADELLAEHATTLKDNARAIAAYERLLDTPARAKALVVLAPLYEASGDPDKLAKLLEVQAKDERDDGKARAGMMKAAEVRATQSKDAMAAIASCQAVVQRFGPARDVLDLLLPLLEAQRQWPELGTALAQSASLQAGAEHAATMSRLGVLRMQRLRDVEGAIAAFDEALRFDPADKTARSTLEKLSSLGENRLQAARVLEPLYRHEQATAPLLKLLELRGSLAETVDERLTALREAADRRGGRRSRGGSRGGRRGARPRRGGVGGAPAARVDGAPRSRGRSRHGPEEAREHPREGHRRARGDERGPLRAREEGGGGPRVERGRAGSHRALPPGPHVRAELGASSARSTISSAIRAPPRSASPSTARPSRELKAGGARSCSIASASSSGETWATPGPRRRRTGRRWRTIRTTRRPTRRSESSTRRQANGTS